MLNNVHAVVIAGGSGSRLWPLSRQQLPKQLLALGGHQSLLAATLARIEPLVSPRHCWIVTGQRHAEGCRLAAPQLVPEQILAEPVARNTTAAVGLAAIHLAAADAHAIMIVLPADHHVAKPAELCRALEIAVSAARRGGIATLGITPTHPETGYGYVQRGSVDPGIAGVYSVRRFCEKPSLERAREFVADGSFDWNAGIFVAQPAVILAEIKRQVPRLHAALERIASAMGQPNYASTLDAAFNDMPSISFDFGVMEGARELCVVPTACGWSDVGSFDALGAMIAPDAAGNITCGRVVAIDSHDCVLYAAASQVLAVVGLHDVAVIQTPDATLVLPTARAQETRAVLTRLGELGWNEYL